MSTSPDTRIIPLEGEPGYMVYVSTTRRADRKPWAHVGEAPPGQFHASLRDAISNTMQYDDNFRHNFSIPLASGSLSREMITGIDAQQLVLRTQDHTAVSPRSVDGHHAVQYKPDGDFLIIIENAGPEDMFDRGLAWIDLTHPDSTPTLLFQLHGGDWTAPDIGFAMSDLFSRVESVMGELLTGMNQQ